MRWGRQRWHRYFLYGDYTVRIVLSIFNVDRCQTSSSVPFSYECGNNALVSILGQPQEQKTKCEKTWFYFLKVLFFYGKYRKYYPIPRSPSILFSTSRYEMMIQSSDSANMPYGPYRWRKVVCSSFTPRFDWHAT